MAVSLEDIHYCARCGYKVILAERFGKNRPVCPSCGWIYFADPKMAAAVLIEKDEKILLVRRANNLKRGFWKTP